MMDDTTATECTPIAWWEVATRCQMLSTLMADAIAKPRDVKSGILLPNDFALAGWDSACHPCADPYVCLILASPVAVCWIIEPDVTSERTDYWVRWQHACPFAGCV